MRLRHLKYLAAYSIPTVVIVSMVLGGSYAFLAIGYVFVAVPFIELFTSGKTVNLSKLEEEVASKDKIYDFLLYALVPLHLFILIYFLLKVNQSEVIGFELLGYITALGMSCGLSINNAHELGHRTKKYEQFLSQLLLMTSLYMHFFIEHNRGHHKNVATDEDPSSGRLGESIYHFFPRTLIGSWKSAWHLEAVRCNNNSIPVVSVKNQMLIFQIIQLLFLLLIFLIFGLKTMLAFTGSACIGILMLETVNYIEHYGLSRKKKGSRYERTLPIHSWNSNHPIGRLIMLELSRHSDHHFMSTRKYQILRHFDESPQMPTGYPGMMLLALIPPIWFNIMNKEIKRFNISKS